MVEKIKERVKESEFESVEECIEFVLREVLEEEEPEMSEEDEEKIKESRISVNANENLYTMNVIIMFMNIVKRKYEIEKVKNAMPWVYICGLK